MTAQSWYAAKITTGRLPLIMCYSVSERLLLNAKWAVFQLYHGTYKLHSLSTIFQLYCGVSFIGGGNWRKPQICRIDKLYYIMLYWVHLTREGFKLTLVVIGTDCIGSCKSNHHMIRATMAPLPYLQLYGKLGGSRTEKEYCEKLIILSCIDGDSLYTTWMYKRSLIKIDEVSIKVTKNND
jgi:hypothetical protein